MNWLLPGFLAGAAFLTLPILLHFLRGKPKTVVPFPSLRFLGPTALRETRRHRIRRWLTLLLRCLIIALLAAAFARPFWPVATEGHGRAVVVVVDNSMSMQVGNRWGTLRSWALSRLDPLKEGDYAGVLLMNPSPVWLVPLGEDIGRAREALRSLEPGFEITRYPIALRLAGDVLAHHAAPTKELVWMADEQRLGWMGMDFQTPLPAGITVQWPPAEAAASRQAAISRASAARTADGVEVRAAVRLYEPESAERVLRLYAGDQLLKSEKISLTRATPAEITLRTTLPAGATPEALRLSLDPDDLAADDTAYLTLRNNAISGVILDKVDGVDFLRHALSSTRLIRDGGMTPAPLPEGEWPLSSVAVLRDPASFTGAAGERLERFLNKGGAAWIFYSGQPDLAAWLKKYGVEETALPGSALPSRLCGWDPDHPLLAPFAGDSLLPLMEARFMEGWSLQCSAAETIASWQDGGPALLELKTAHAHLLLSGFSLSRDSSTWISSPSFVPFVHQAVLWLSNARSVRQDWRIGDIIPLPEQEGSWRALDGPRKGSDQKVRSRVIATAPGLFEFTNEGERLVFAINVPQEESDLAPWPDPAKMAALSQPGRAAPQEIRKAALLTREAAEAQQRLWWWLLAVAFLCLLAELGLSNRTTM